MNLCFSLIATLHKCLAISWTQIGNFFSYLSSSASVCMHTWCIKFWYLFKSVCMNKALFLLIKCLYLIYLSWLKNFNKAFYHKNPEQFHLTKYYCIYMYLHIHLNKNRKCVFIWVHICVCVCVCERERERKFYISGVTCTKTESVCSYGCIFVCVCERERERERKFYISGVTCTKTKSVCSYGCIFVCVWEREREREREREKILHFWSHLYKNRKCVFIWVHICVCERERERENFTFLKSPVQKNHKVRQKMAGEILNESNEFSFESQCRYLVYICTYMFISKIKFSKCQYMYIYIYIYSLELFKPIKNFHFSKIFSLKKYFFWLKLTYK